MIEGFVLLAIALLLIVAWGWFELRTFLRKHSEIATAEDLIAFKSLARFNMHLALGYLLLGGILIGWFVLMAHAEGLTGVLLGFAFFAPSGWLAGKIKVLELQSRSLPSNEVTQAEYAQVSQTWLKKLWPDF